MEVVFTIFHGEMRKNSFLSEFDENTLKMFQTFLACEKNEITMNSLLRRMTSIETKLLEESWASIAT